MRYFNSINVRENVGIINVVVSIVVFDVYRLDILFQNVMNLGRRKLL